LDATKKKVERLHKNRIVDLCYQRNYNHSKQPQYQPRAATPGTIFKVHQPLLHEQLHSEDEVNQWRSTGTSVTTAVKPGHYARDCWAPKKERETRRVDIKRDEESVVGARIREFDNKEAEENILALTFDKKRD